MRTTSVRRPGAVLLTAAAGVSLLLAASRAPAAGGYRAPGQATSGQAVHPGCPPRQSPVRDQPISAQ